MVYRCFTEKKPGFDTQAELLRRELRSALGISGAETLRIVNRYDVEGISEDVYALAKTIVFSEPQTDMLWEETLTLRSNEWVIPVEPLPGQFDQRADSCAQCIQMLAPDTEKPEVRTAVLYIITGNLSGDEKSRIMNHLINPVENRLASADKPPKLSPDMSAERKLVQCVDGFISAGDSGLSAVHQDYGLAMDMADLRFIQGHYKNVEKRDPTEAELLIMDTYWSDHCRHTTFNTVITDVEILDAEVASAYAKYLGARQSVYGERIAEKPVTLMDIATVGAKLLKKKGLLQNLDESEEVNACSIKIKAVIDGKAEDWLLMFKNETHNHPTEIEPFGGAATCVGGAIRDPLSGRAWVYQSMRISGCADPRTPLEETMPGKLSQRRLTQTAAAGFASYGNQIGLATGLVREIYHPGYAAKRMECGAVIGAVPAANVRRERPEPGDAVLLLGGRTGRDGIGGATGSSKTHNMESLTKSAAEVQKGNAPEERKLQRLFRNPEAAKMIKRCNDFGAGGVSVAVGELADGLRIDLDAVRLKYAGLSAAETALSESQERMAVVVAAENVRAFIKEAETENLECYQIAEVTSKGRMVMESAGETVVDISRDFLSSNGAEKRITVTVPEPHRDNVQAGQSAQSVMPRLRSLLSDLRFCSQRGLSDRFDSTIGAATVLAPFGGKYKLTPAQAMAALIPALDGEAETCSVMSYAFDPYASAVNPYKAARDAVTLSIAKLAASGCDVREAYLSFQEYFERLRDEPERWGKPFSALLGALEAQLELGVAAIGGKDSMSGSFMELDVPPTLISFAVAPCPASRVISPEFKCAGSHVYLLSPGDNLQDIKEMWLCFRDLPGIRSAWAVTEGGIAEAVFKMALGNGIGFKSTESLSPDMLFTAMPGALIVESETDMQNAVLIGRTIDEPQLVLCGETENLDNLRKAWESTLEDVFPTKTELSGDVTAITGTYAPTAPNVAGTRRSKPTAVITVFPGTNCEYDTKRAIERAGMEAETVLIRNLTSDWLADSIEKLEAAIRRSRMLVFPGGFSGGDEPDGSGKFIVSLLRNPGISDAVMDLLRNRDGLILGVCNGFQALIKLGLLPYGEIRQTDADCPTLTHNLIGRHQSGYYTTRIASVNSPWLSLCKPGQLHTLAVSHGEGRFVAPENLLSELAANGQIATQYADEYGNPSMDVSVNPNGSMLAVEGILSPDGRVFGKMGHAERRGKYVGINIAGNKHQPIFEAGAAYLMG